MLPACLPVTGWPPVYLYLLKCFPLPAPMQFNNTFQHLQAKPVSGACATHPHINTARTKKRVPLSMGISLDKWYMFQYLERRNAMPAQKGSMQHTACKIRCNNAL